jgi:hypothetical protein
MGPITNYELGKMTHHEYEAQASRYWRQDVTREDKPSQKKVHKLVLALSGIALTMVLFAQILPF